MEIAKRTYTLVLDEDEMALHLQMANTLVAVRQQLKKMIWELECEVSCYVNRHKKPLWDEISKSIINEIDGVLERLVEKYSIFLDE
jgi:hypothetical protein